jgi:hypothetical protein
VRLNVRCVILISDLYDLFVCILLLEPSNSSIYASFIASLDYLSVTVVLENDVIWVVALHVSIRFDIIVLQELDTNTNFSSRWYDRIAESALFKFCR